MANRASAVRYSIESADDDIRPKRGTGGVSFQPKLSVFSITGTENEFEMSGVEGEEFEVTMETRSRWVLMAESIYLKKIFRAVSLVNLIVLVLSIPFYNLNQLEGNQEFIVSTQFQVITVLDFILSCIYTFNLVIRCIKTVTAKKRDNIEEDHTKHGTSVRNMSALLLSINMWYCFGIGIYRSINPLINHWYYTGWAPRAILIIFPILNLSLKAKSSAVRKLLAIFKWKQMAMVTGFYFIFVFIFALMGIHIIGGLDHFCAYRTVDEDGNFSMIPAIPLTHCNPDNQRFCDRNTSNNTGLVCLKFPSEDNPQFFFDYRSYVYYGQFRSILDALYAVYEASTLELWSFMLHTAIEGRSYTLPFIFYFLLILFLVVILQQSIFLVVIIESFADIRDQSLFVLFGNKSSSQKSQNRPTTVLTLEDPATNKLKLNSSETDTSAKFLENYSKFLVYFEKVFIVLVMIDAIVTATKHVNMKYKEHAMALQVWQGTVSVLFVIEIGFLFLFHLYHGQWKLFFRRPYYLCLTVLAIGGLVASLPIDINGFYFYNPLLPGSLLAIFQALRFMRLLRCSESLLEFTLNFTGKSIPLLSAITLLIICWLAVFNAQLFGFVTNYPEGCSEISGQHFGTFVEAFESTFQIVMNEAWTDVTSEVMCRSKYWFVTNFYFIVIHLFSSLIFLNFFGAVILDNLEYDEEEKKAKLEEIKKKEAEFGETVPFRLQIFKKLGNEPKKLKPPPGIGGDDPKLDEVEVRKFFDSATTSNIVEDPQDLIYLHTPSASKSSQPSTPGRKRISQLRQLSLVTSDSYDLIQSDTPEVHGIFNSVSSILNYISLWRKYNEEDQSRDPKSSHIHYLFGQSPYERTRADFRSSNIRSEYEVFKEKHRYFDMALFCMPPEHKLRRFCTKLLTAQAEPPHYIPIHGKGAILQMFKKRLLFIFRWILSRMSYYTWIVFLSLLVIISTQILEVTHEEYHPDHTYTPLMEVFYLLLMLSWLGMRVISRGCFLNPHAAINSVWDVVDWILVLDTALLLFLTPFWNVNDFSFLSIKLNVGSLGSVFYEGLFDIRCLRPLHVISVLNSLRAVVREIVEGWRNLIKAIVLLLGFIFMFASLGVQLFAGTDKNPQAFCNDPSIKTMEDCTGQFTIKLSDGSREFLPFNLPSQFFSTEMLVPRVWYTHTRDFPFNNVVFAFITLFELLTLEGWPEVRNMLERDTLANVNMHVYIHVFVFFAVNIGLQLFLGIVVNNFNEHKPGHTFLLSVEQNRWSELMQRVSLQRPDKLPEEPRNNLFRLKLHRILTHHRYRFIPTFIIALSALTLVVSWDKNIVSVEVVQTLLTLSIILNMFTVLEMFLKLLAFGPVYFQSWRNLFDFILSIPTIGYAISGVVLLAMPTSDYYVQLSYLALSLAVFKLITIMVKYSAMLNLLLTVLSTLLRSMSLVAVLIVMTLCYALLGISLFGNLRTGEAINLYLLNFKGFFTSVHAVWRSLTGEDWYQIMWDAGVSPPYCDNVEANNCGNLALAVMYFGSFTFIVPFILLNVFIAVLLENFSIFYNDEETTLDLVAMKDFKKKWRIFDLHARGHIPLRRVKLLLRSLDLQSYYTFVPGAAREPVPLLTDDELLPWEMEEELEQEALSFINKPTDGNASHSTAVQHGASDSEINVEFLNVLRMLAYRCEDINKRLEPQELFARKELEQTIQLDVAEKCILEWLRKTLKPIVLRRREIERIMHRSEDDAQQNPLSVKEKRHQLLAMRNAQSQFLNVQAGWGKQHSLDTEDEENDFKRLSLERLPQANSEERIDYYGLEESADASSGMSSFNRMKQNYMPSAKTNSAKEWFKMQEEWMDKVKTDQNYFDDHL